MSLRGRGVLVTRPTDLAPALAALIEAAGGRPILYPAIVIEQLPEPPQLAHLDDFDLIAFISPTAVRAAAKRRSLQGRRRVAAIGAGTRRELEAAGAREALMPASDADSEALLALPAMQDLRGKRVLICRGQGGRALLGDTLRSRGARVEYAELYRRLPPREDPGHVLSQWAAGQVHAVTVSSTEGLNNLHATFGDEGAAFMRRTALFVPHARVGDAAKTLAIEEVIVAGPGDEQMMQRLVAYFDGRP